MRKAAIAAVIVLAMGFGTAALFQSAAAGGFGSCTYRCICSVPYKCCTSGGNTSCKPAPDGPIQCPQVAC